MRRALLQIGILSAMLFLIVFVLGAQLSPLFAKFGNPTSVQNSLLFYLLLVTVGAIGLFLLKPLIGIVLLLLLLLLLVILFQMDVIYLIHVVG